MVLTQQRHTHDQDGFPTTQLLLLALVRLAEPIALTSIFPYAWRLVLDFDVGDENDASFYAGVLVAAFAFAEAISGMFWGALSDRVGRKPVLLIGCLGTISSLLIVGTSVNFWMALCGRLLGGALNGNVGVIQTMVGELVTNPKHEPKAYSINPFIWSLGGIVGPCVGGLFSSPAKTWPTMFSANGAFAHFPYLLPNLICAGLMVISMSAGCFFLVETHPQFRPCDASMVPDHEQPYRTRAYSTTWQTQPTDNSPAANLTQESYGTFNAVDEEVVEEAWYLRPDGTSKPGSLRSWPPQKAFTKRVVMLTIALGLFTYHSMTYDYLLPVFLQSDRVTSGEQLASAVVPPVANNHGSLAGGLGLSVKNSGYIMAVNGVIALFVQAVVFPIMADRLGVWKLFTAVTVLHPVAYFIVPWLALLPTSVLYPGVYVCLMIRNCLSILAYPLLLILIKEAAPAPGCLGKINGLAASTGAACRTIASPIAGLLYGLGLSINFTALAWWASGLIAFAGALQVLTIKRDRSGPQYHVRSAEPFQQHQHDSDGQRWLRHKPSVVRIQIREDDSGYISEDESRPLIRRES